MKQDLLDGRQATTYKQHLTSSLNPEDSLVSCTLTQISWYGAIYKQQAIFMTCCIALKVEAGGGATHDPHASEGHGLVGRPTCMMQVCAKVDMHKRPMLHRWPRLI